MTLIDDMRLTRNFTVGEFFVSKDFPVLAEKLQPTPLIINNLYLLSAMVLQPARDILNSRHKDELAEGEEIKVIIMSGFRDPVLNAAVGGWPTSLHMEAVACDPTTDPIKYLEELYDILLDRFYYSWIQAILYRDKNVAHVALPSPGVPRLCEIR